MPKSESLKSTKSESKNNSSSNTGSDNVNIAIFKLRGGAVYIPYSDPETLIRILQGVKMLQESGNKENKESKEG